MTLPRPLPPHGTYARAVGRPQKGIPGCRCDKCFAEARAYNKRRHLLSATGRNLSVDAAPAGDHIRSLVEAGASVARIATASRCAYDTVGHLSRGTLSWIRRSTSDRIMAVRLNDVLCPHRMVPAAGSIRRTRALMAIGHNIAAISSAAGSHRTFIQTIVAGTSTEVRATTAEKIAAVYSQLALTPGDSANARARAAKAGWQGPLAWDDIDDPNAVPDATGVCGTVRGWHIHRLEDIPMCARCQAAQDAWLAEHAHLPSRQRNPLLLAERNRARGRTAALAEDWEELQEQGYTMPMAAKRLRVSLDALHAAVSRRRDLTPAA